MISLSHIGEILISKLLEEPKVISDLGSEIPFNPNNLIVVPEIRLDKSGDYIFDGVHKVDVSVLNTETMTCFPIEAKLGFDRLAKTSFETRFLEPCKTSHNNSRISGSMISILERKLPKCISNEDLYITHNGQQYKLTKKWGLICRDKVIHNWKSNGYPELSDNCSIISFEKLVTSYGGKDKFNELVKELISFDYYDNWECAHEKYS